MLRPVSYLWRGWLLYGRAHCADCEFRLVGHDVGGLDVPVVHGVLERCASVGVLVAHVAIKGDFGSSSAMRKITLLTKSSPSCAITVTRGFLHFQYSFFEDDQFKSH